MIRVEHGDCREVIKTLADDSIDSIITDPPYHLVAMTKRFGAANAAPAKSADHQRIARGFMQTEWDGSGVAFDPETWIALKRVLRPGGFLLAFGAPRSHHRLACAIEDAGFVIQDCIMWLFGQGWPKRRDMLKPAYEPIVMAYNPGAPRFLNIDGCRVEVADNVTFERIPGDRPRDQYRTGTTPAPIPSDLGRWPANIITDSSEEVIGVFDKAGTRSSGKEVSRRDTGKGHQGNVYGAESRSSGETVTWYGDSGSASRFFFSAKAGREDRWGSKHPTVKPVELIRWLMRLVTPPRGLVLDPFAGSGTAGVAALAEGFDAILIEREAEYVADIRERLAYYEGGDRHAVNAKNRNRAKTSPGPLFE
jgi:site-specific DNA-methyltransferase (adenine-specific)